MPDRPATPHVADRIESSLERLPRTARATVLESVRERTGLPAVLARTVGAAVGESTAEGRREVAAAISFLEAYERVRADLLDPDCDRYAAPRERDVAVLASDYLHASAHETLARAPLPADRRLACYRRLTAGARSLSERLLAEVDAATSDVHTFPSADRRPGTRAVLAGTGSAVGAAAAGGSENVIDAMEAYGASLAAAAERIASSASDPFARLCEVLDGDRGSAVEADPGSRGAAEDLGRPLGDARGALERLPASPARDRLERATTLLVTEHYRAGE